ncbi:SWR1 complex subunit 6 isoform X1 [Aristolochia californica]|uniref:SWR1 complex subunit 6 isoform X1 n=1 Tax=Aristolochia californica TaxID=171875 RepID=UPI0035D74CCF
MDDENAGSFRRMSSRNRKVAPKMAAALASSDNRTQAALARLEALENDNAAVELVEANDDEDASLDDEDQGYIQKRQSKSTKRKTRQAKALENAKKAPRTFVELLQDANLETLPPYVPSYLRATVGPPSSTSRRHFCTVCGYAAKYTCVRCGVRFCSSRCQVIHNDTRCLKFVA